MKNKVIHKKVCEQWLPAQAVHRRKVGFNEAMGKWMRQNLDTHLTRLIGEPDSITKNLLNASHVQQLQREHASGSHDHQRMLFLLLSIETWRKVFV